MNYHANLSRCLRSLSMTGLAVISIGTAPVFRAADSDSKESFQGSHKIVEDPAIKVFDPEQQNDKYSLSPDDFIYGKAAEKVHELGAMLEVLEREDSKRFETVFQETVEFLRQSDNPEQTLEQIENRLDRLVERFMDGFSPNSGQNDRLDDAMRGDYDPFVNTMAEFFARTEQMLQDLGQLNPLEPNPLLMEPGESNSGWDMSDPAQQTAALLEKHKSQLKAAEAAAEKALEDWNLETGEGALEAIDAANQVDNLKTDVETGETQLIIDIADNNDALNPDTTNEEMPLPPGEGGYGGDVFDAPGAELFIRLSLALNADQLERDIHTWGLTMPDPDNPNTGTLPNEPRPERGQPVDHLVNPGSGDLYNGEPAPVPEAFEGLPIIDNFGGTVDPMDPAAVHKISGSPDEKDAEENENRDSKVGN